MLVPWRVNIGMMNQIFLNQVWDDVQNQKKTGFGLGLGFFWHFSGIFPPVFFLQKKSSKKRQMLSLTPTLAA